MREIKFRAWDSSAREMMHNVGFHPHICERHDTEDFAEPTSFTVSPMFDRFKIMQFTGQKDKNDVEIYEGDVVKRETCLKRKNGHTYRVVMWNQSYCGFGRIGEASRYEVIGNIHQNPELLK